MKAYQGPARHENSVNIKKAYEKDLLIKKDKKKTRRKSQTAKQ
jgi:hypothetical protein